MMYALGLPIWFAAQCLVNANRTCGMIPKPIGETRSAHPE